MTPSEMWERRKRLLKKELDTIHARSIRETMDGIRYADCEEEIMYVPKGTVQVSSLPSTKRMEDVGGTWERNTSFHDASIENASSNIIAEIRRGVETILSAQGQSPSIQRDETQNEKSTDELYQKGGVPDLELERFNRDMMNINLKGIDKMNGTEFEHYCAELFRVLGFEAIVTTSSYDFGVDVIAKNEYVRLGIQCKIANKEPLGNQAIQEIIAGIRYHNLDKGILITNGTVHKKAHELAKKTHIIIWERNKLYEKNLEMLKILQEEMKKEEV